MRSKIPKVLIYSILYSALALRVIVELPQSPNC